VRRTRRLSNSAHTPRAISGRILRSLSDTVGVRASGDYDHHDGNIYDTVNKFDYGAATDRAPASPW